MRKYLLSIFLVAALASQAHAMKLFVAPDGSDAWSGQIDKPNKAQTNGPFATIERARDEIRQIKQRGALPDDGVTVELRAGTYPLKQSFALEAQDSGTEKSPIEYRAKSGEDVRLIGGKVLDGWQKVKDEAILSRLDAAARGRVWQINLREQGMTDLPGIKPSRYWGQSEPGVELFFQEKPMTLARWPNEGFAKIADVVGGELLSKPDEKQKLDKHGVFVYEGDRPSRWAGESDVWLHGFWSVDWADQRQRIESIDTTKHVITLVKPDHEFGYRQGQWYYAFNVLAELDQPGEWYLDHQTGILYFWPPAPLTTNKVTISLLPDLVTLHDVSNVKFSGLTLEAARGVGVNARGGKNIQISSCTIRNVGNWGVNIKGASESGVEGCDIYNVGEGGIDLVGGDRKTLTPSNLYADNNHIHHYSRWNPVYKPGIRVDGVGCRVSHNLIHDAPHMGIGFGGNDHIIEFNEIHDVCNASNDAGVIYAGQDWSMRGNIIRNNYLHHVTGFEKRGCSGVYLDDNFSSATIYGNVFYKVPRAILLGGGRDITVDNNLFVDCDAAVFVDARGLGWRAYGQEELTRRLKEMPYQGELWRTRYPQLANILENEPMAPKGIAITHNVAVGGRFDDIEERARPYLDIKDNFMAGDPLFVNQVKEDFRLRSNSPAYAIGFKPIPFERIGLSRK